MLEGSEKHLAGKFSNRLRFVFVLGTSGNSIFSVWPVWGYLSFNFLKMLNSASSESCINSTNWHLVLGQKALIFPSPASTNSLSS